MIVVNLTEALKSSRLRRAQLKGAPVSPDFCDLGFRGFWGFRALGVWGFRGFTGLVKPPGDRGRTCWLTFVRFRVQAAVPGLEFLKFGAGSWGFDFRQMVVLAF